MKNLKNQIGSCIGLLALLMIFPFKAGAQTGEVGGRFMPTVSSFEINSTTGGKVEGEATLGYGFGALFGYNFNENVGMQGEIIYNTNSQKYKEASFERKVTLRYLNIPLLLSLNTGKTKPVNLNAVVGPQIGISVGSKIFTEGGGSSNTPVLSVKKGDLGFAYGAGVDFGLNADKTFRLGLGFRGVYGLLDVSDNSHTITTDNYYLLDRSHVKTYSGYVGISYLF